MLVYVFPGQGSQSKGMGGELFDTFKELTVQADNILGYSIKELCLEDPDSKLGQTQYTQPALFVTNSLSYLKKVNETGIKPDYVAGHSLGEYNALFAAGAFDFETGLKLVQVRGDLMSRETGGAMAAVIGLGPEEIVEVLERNGLQNIDIANYNSPFQIVIAGLKTDIDRAKPIFEANSRVKMYIPLKVSGAFHSRYLKDAGEEFGRFLDSCTFSPLTLPVISNVYARPYLPHQIKQILKEQITHPVKWTESIRYLMGKGKMEFLEIGNGKILTGLIQRIQKEAEPLIVPGEAETAHQEPTGKNVAPDLQTQLTGEPAPKKSGAAKLPVISKDEPKTAQMAKPDQTAAQKPPSAPDLSLGKVVSKVVGNIQEKVKAATNAKGSAEKSNRKTHREVTGSSLGNGEFKKDYHLNYAYLIGGMGRGISSPEMVIKAGKAGVMGFFGTAHLELSQIEAAIREIQSNLNHSEAWGINLLYNPNDSEKEEAIVDLLLKCGVTVLEASNFLTLTPALVKFRLKGLTKNQRGEVIIPRRIIAKLSRPEIAESFLSPAPERMVSQLVAENKITVVEAELAKKLPMADDLCASADSGGHTDGGVASALLPAIIKLRNDLMGKYCYPKQIRVGVAGGIGTPEAAASAFILGADFICAGSINQCTVEAHTSSTVKDMLQQINVQDTDLAPADDLFELGAKIRVLKKGLFFPGRANKLYDLYRQFNSIQEIDAKTKAQIEEKYFKKTLDQVFADLKPYLSPGEIEKSIKNPKFHMALIFKWYGAYGAKLAINGAPEGKVDYQVYCGPALGAFNQWVKGTPLEDWKNRHVDEIAQKLMEEAAQLLARRFQEIIG